MSGINQAIGQILGPAAPIFEIFTQRAQQYAQAATTASQIARGVSLGQQAKADPGVRTFTRTISLELRQAASSAVPSSTNTNSGTSTSINKSSNTTGNVQQGPLVAALVFDVVLQADAYAQKLTRRHVSRQSTKQTISGFYTNELGIGLGSISLEANVIFWASAPNKVQSFKNLLYLAKRQTPFSTSSTYLLYLHNAWTGESFLITQKDLTIEENADALNRGFIKIEADILADYSGSYTAATQQDIGLQSSAAATISQTELLSITKLGASSG